MRKLLVLLIIVALGAVIYSVLANPDKKQNVLGVIEQSTGVNLEAAPEKWVNAAGSEVDEFLMDLGNTLTDPELYKALERWGRDALNTLDTVDLENLKRDLKKASGEQSTDYDAVFQKYLAESQS